MSKGIVLAHSPAGLVSQLRLPRILQKSGASSALAQPSALTRVNLLFTP